MWTGLWGDARLCMAADLVQIAITGFGQRVVGCGLAFKSPYPREVEQIAFTTGRCA